MTAPLLIEKEEDKVFSMESTHLIPGSYEAETVSTEIKIEMDVAVDPFFIPKTEPKTFGRKTLILFIVKYI